MLSNKDIRIRIWQGLEEDERHVDCVHTIHHHSRFFEHCIFWDTKRNIFYSFNFYLANNMTCFEFIEYKRVFFHIYEYVCL